MEVEVLLEVVNALTSELSPNPLLPPLDELAKALKAGDTNAIEASLAKLERILSESVASHFVPSRDQVLRSIGAEKIFGRRLYERLEGIVHETALGPEEKGAIVSGIRSEIHRFHGTLNNAERFLRDLGFAPSSVADDDYELGVSFPHEVAHDLELFQKQVDGLDRHLRVFNEIAGQAGSPPLKRLSTGSLEIFVELAPVAAAAFAFAIDKALNWRKTWWETELLKQQIKEKVGSDQAVGALSVQQEEARALAVESAKQELLERFLIEGVEDGRKNEIQIATKAALLYLSDRIDHGVVFEVQTSSMLISEAGLKAVPEALSDDPAATVRMLGGAMREIAWYRDQLQQDQLNDARTEMRLHFVDWSL